MQTHGNTGAVISAFTHETDRRREKHIRVDEIDQDRKPRKSSTWTTGLSLTWKYEVTNSRLKAASINVSTFTENRDNLSL